MSDNLQEILSFFMEEIKQLTRENAKLGTRYVEITQKMGNMSTEIEFLKTKNKELTQPTLKGEESHG